MTIEEVRNELLDVMHGINKSKLSLPDLKLYADILKTTSEIQTKSFCENLTETMRMGFGSAYASPKLQDLK